MPAYEVTEIYRYRWDIEVLFKFIKQNLGYRHFLNHTMNGMKVHIYMIIITALLFLVYKIRNNLHEFKIASLQFALDLSESFVCSIILLSIGCCQPPQYNYVSNFQHLWIILPPYSRFRLKRSVTLLYILLLFFHHLSNF
ncbi:transposase [Wolbachia endosymbiont (group E) of Neria commutata]|uniref:transposase n=1 Tax=Wolbachia endosymbiont (group E) of Neria commutata TaxID=3066149 RepID=UPI003979A659